MDNRQESRWWNGGIAFSCTGCGKCCSGPPGVVWLDEETEEQIAEFLSLDLDTFRRRYTRRVDGRISLREETRWTTEPRLEQVYDCIFLKEGKFCSVYPVRPIQCRTYPFWTDVMKSERSWKQESLRCEGISLDGEPNVSDQTIEQALAQT